MKFVKFILLILIFTFCLAQDIPKLTGRVTDLANLLSIEQRQQLDDFLMSYEQQTSNQLAVLIIPTLAGDSLEDYSMRVVEKWKLGQKNKNNGLLLLIALQDRKIRIEVGYGLEPKITDAFSGEVIREILAPAFLDNKFYDGIYAAMYAITQKIGDEFQADKFQTPVYRVDQTGTVSNIPEGKLELVFILVLLFGFLTRSIGKVNYRRGFWGSIFLPILVFMFLGIPFSLPLLLMLIIFGFPFTFITILFSIIFSSFGRGGFYGGGFGGGSSGFGGFSGGGGSFGGGGSSGGW